MCNQFVPKISHFGTGCAKSGITVRFGGYLLSQCGTHTMESEVEVKNLMETGESGDSRIRRILLPV